MGEKIQYTEKEELTLADQPVRTINAMFTEVKALASVMMSMGPVGVLFANDLSILMTEFIHWCYDASGKHLAPSQIVLTVMTENDEREKKIQ